MSPSRKSARRLRTKAEIARLKSGLEKKEERFDERRDKMIRKANEEAQQILREAQSCATA